MRDRPPDRLLPSEAPTGFFGAWEQLVDAAGVPTLPRRCGRTPRVPLTPIAAGPDLSCPERRGHAGRAVRPTLRRAAGRQFLVGSARPPALGDLCRSDAAGVARATRHRHRDAFAKLTTAVLLEIGWHNPLAAAMGVVASPSGNWRTICWRSCSSARCCWPIGCMAARPLRSTRRRRASGWAVTSCYTPGPTSHRA